VHRAIILTSVALDLRRGIPPRAKAPGDPAVRFMKRILLLLNDAEIRSTLTEWLPQHQILGPGADKTAFASKPIPTETFDLCLIDLPNLVQRRAEVQARKKVEIFTLFLPFLLILSRTEIVGITPELWEVIDEILVQPTAKIEVQLRVEALLRTRQMALDLAQANILLKQKLINQELTSKNQHENKFSPLVESALEQLIHERTMILSHKLTFLAAKLLERQQVETALRERTARYRAIAELIADYAYAFRRSPEDDSLYLEWMTDTFTQKMGYTVEELNAQGGWLGLVHPADLSIISQRYNRVLEGQLSVSEFRVLAKTGEVHWLRERRRALWDAAQKVVERIYGAAQDITEYKRAEEALRESEMRFRLLAENAPDIIYRYRLRPPGFEYVNPSVQTVLGYSPEEYYADPKIQLRILHPDSQTHLETFLQTSQPHRDPPVVRFIHKDGHDVWIEHRQWLAIDEAGNPSAIEGIFRDITQRKQAEEALAQKAEELTRSNKELELFAYVASHDLQEPLRMVSSYVQLLAEEYRGQLDAEADEFIAYAVDGANRMQRLIDDLLQYSRVGRRGRDFNPTDSNLVLQHALTNLRVSIEEHAAQITADQLPLVLADEVQLEQLLQNLLSNAIKFCGAKAPRVHLTAKQLAATEEWLFEVQDNGIGIEAQYNERIFQIFQRLHNRNEYPGTGIGLAVCRKIIERHGGHIWVESAPGEGTTFFFTLKGTKVHVNEQQTD